MLPHSRGHAMPSRIREGISFRMSLFYLRRFQIRLNYNLETTTMRILRFVLTRIVLSLLVLSGIAFAATNPVISPRGLALDANGNLYVANTGGNNILVFDPSYSELVSKTITAGINTPMSVALDSLGNLWVANNGDSNGGTNGSISQYRAGVQNTGATITRGIDSPFSISVDGIDNLFVENNHANVTVYRPTTPFSQPSSALLQQSANGTSFFGVLATAQGVIFLGTSGSSGTPPINMYGVEDSFLQGAPLQYGAVGEALALTSDGSRNAYLANVDGSVDKVLARGGDLSQIMQAPFPPTGIAVDSKRGRIYLADYDDSQIAVYSMTGTLLKIIQ